MTKLNSMRPMPSSAVPSHSDRLWVINMICTVPTHDHNFEYRRCTQAWRRPGEELAWDKVKLPCVHRHM